MRAFSDSESENETIISGSFQSLEAFCHTEIAVNGTTWSKLEVGGSSGRYPIHQIFKGIAGPSGYEKRNVIEGSVSNHIKTCTEEETNRVLKEYWKISTKKLLAFIGILYARGAYEANSLNAFYFWSKEWGLPFFVIRCLEMNLSKFSVLFALTKKTDRFERLCTDKFAMISEIWNQFINNSQCCYKPHENISTNEQLFPTKARCKFTQYMANKSHKFDIKFWLAVDV
uniref:DDE_Tnp_1_7 domain-containing protein n=1 Tax=Strongyloides venezuelensis TaxID=75913 RepID=A0A0K0G3K6_STRVS